MLLIALQYKSLRYIQYLSASSAAARLGRLFCCSLFFSLLESTSFTSGAPLFTISTGNSLDNSRLIRGIFPPGDISQLRVYDDSLCEQQYTHRLYLFVQIQVI